MIDELMMEIMIHNWQTKYPEVFRRLNRLINTGNKWGAAATVQRQVNRQFKMSAQEETIRLQ